MWRAAVAAALPAACLPGHWPAAPAGRLAVIACGKAAVPMAMEAVRHYREACEGIVIFPADPAASPPDIPRFRLYAASHPVPDRRSVAAASAALELARGLAAEDLLLVLLSGGGSSLMCLPAEGVSLQEKQALSRHLLSCGATIGEINCVRKHLSRVKGGRLARASAAPVCTLAISDIPGNEANLIASGPTAQDATTLDDARAVLARYAIAPTAGVERALRDPANETPRLVSAAGQHALKVVASGMTALEAAARWCRQNGIEPVVLGDAVEGEASVVAEEHARLAARLATAGRASCLLSGGETTVSLGTNPGSGGRNTEYALALALAFAGQEGLWGLAADTDGIDGSGGHCGAMVDPSLPGRARAAGLDAADYLRRHDSATFFSLAGGLMTAGPTGTNVNDFRAILVNP